MADKIYIPTADDSAKCFQDYTEDVARRQQSHQLKPGEDVKQDASGRVQISGQVAVMEINGLLAKIIFDKNTNQEFYVEESFPLDWMYPYLEPHGLIFKLNRQPLTELSDEIVQRDHDYWTKYDVADDWRLVERRHVGSVKSPPSRKKSLPGTISAVSPATRVSCRTPIRTKCFPRSAVPSPGFMPGARNTRRTRRKRSA